MRRKHKKIIRPLWPSRHGCILLGCGAVLLLLFWGFCMFDAKIQPVLQQMAQYECYSVTVGVMNEVVSQQIALNPELYDGMYHMETDEAGIVRAVLAEPSVINQIRLNMTTAVNQALQKLPEQKIYIPLGSLTDYALLNDLGPDWRLTLSPKGYVETEIEEKVEALAINRTFYQAVLVLRVTINMLLDGTSSTEQVEHRVPLSSVLIAGETPRYYSSETG